MKVAVITDTHWGARNDSLIFADHFQKFYENVFFPKLKDEGINTIIHMGDAFDRRKFINFVSLKRAKEMFFDVAQQSGIDIHLTTGNHDTAYKNTSEVNSPSLLLEDYDNLHIYTEATDITLGGVDILMMPWINPDNRDKANTAMSKSKAKIMMGHLEITGFEMNKGSFSRGGLEPNVLNNFDAVYSGHFHHKSSKNNIHYLGNPYEITWNDYDDPRGFHIFDTDTLDMEFVPNPHRMFYKIWYNDEDVKDIKELCDFDYEDFKGTYVKVIISKKTNPFWFDQFIQKLYDADTHNIQIVDDHFNINQVSEDDILEDVEDTLTILSKSVADLPIDVDKKSLDILVKNLYNEAITLEVA